jgi:uncharacterized membrane protein
LTKADQGALRSAHAAQTLIIPCVVNLPPPPRFLRLIACSLFVLFILAFAACESPANPGEPDTYGISLSKTETHVFDDAYQGYSAITPLTVTITNTGNQATGNLSAVLSGASAGSFALSADSIASIAAGGTGTFAVGPKTSLAATGGAARTYTATLTVSGGNSIAASFDLSFTVYPAESNPDPVYSIALNESGTFAFATLAPGYAAIAPLFVTVSNTGNRATGALAAALSGDSASSFALTGSSIASIAVDGERTFSVAPKMSLGEGTYTATVTVSGDNNLAASFGLSFTVDAAQAYGISLSVNGTHAFDDADFGYEEPEPLTVTVTNTGNQATGALVAALSGANAGSFALTGSSIASIAAGGTGTFAVAPKTGLTATGGASGTYAATVTVSGGNSIAARSFGVSFTVHPAESAPVYSIALDASGTHTFAALAPGYAAIAPLTVSVANTGDQATGALVATLSGGSASSFALTGSSIASIAVGGTGTFTVAPKTSLVAGTYTATVTVSGGNSIVARSFGVSFTVNAAQSYGISLSVTGTHAFPDDDLEYAEVEPLTVTVTNTGTNSTGFLTVELSGGDWASFNLDRVTLLPINPGATRTFIVKPNTGLAKKTYTTDVLVYNDDIHGEFSLSFTVWNFTNAADQAAYLNKAAGGTTVNNPVLLPINHGAVDWAALAGAINTAGKYVALDISTSSPAATSIESGAFLDCAKLVSISFPAASSIGDSTFENCTNLISVNFPAVSSIGTSAFSGCGLTEISLPASLTSIGPNPFIGNVNLTTIAVDSNNPEFSARNGMLLDKAGATLLAYPGASGTVTLSGITSIGDFAFVACRNLISVSFPAIASIGNQAFHDCASLTEINLPASLTSIGFNPFTYCINLTTITVDSNNPQFSSRNGMLLDKADATLFAYPSASGTVTLSDITSIEDLAFFECTNLISASFPEASSIGDSAFDNCTSLISVSFPNATSIGGLAFNGIGNKALAITLPQNAPTLSFATTDDPNFYSKTVTVKTPAGRTGYDAAWEDLFKTAFGTGASITLNFENLE